MEKLQFYFSNAGFSELETTEITSFFTRREFEKGQHFVNEGKLSSEFGFLEKGQFQYYSFNDLGEERTTYISLPDTFVASLLAYLTESPARENIRALTNATLWIIQKKDVDFLKSKFSKFKDFYISIIEWQICCIDKAKFDLITLTAEQRYQKLFKEEPVLLQEVPLQYIASMLGITPRHLSRLRNKAF